MIALDRRAWLRRAAGLATARVAAPAVLAAAAPARAGGRPLQVLASFSILADLASALAGPLAEVTALVGADADPHGFQPAPRDLMRVARADVLLVNGLGFEGWLDRLLGNARPRGAVVVASDAVERRQLGTFADPHAWLSPRQAVRYTDVVEAALAQALRGAGATAGTVALAERAARYRQQLQALDGSLRRALAPIPEDARQLITTHGAFGYLGRDYGLQITALQAGVADAESTAGQMARLVRQIRGQRAVALFAENTTDLRLLQRVAEETGVAIGGTLYGDALSPPDGPAPSYLRLLQHNASTISQGLHQAAARKAASGAATGR